MPTSAPATSTRSTRCPIRAGSPTGPASGSGPLDLEALVKGPDTSNGPAPGPWTVIARKSEGVTPGFTIRDTAGEIYWIKFDPKGFAEMASGAELISTKFFHAFGYHVAENYLATLPPGRPAGGAGRHHEGRRWPGAAADVWRPHRDCRGRGTAARRQLPRARQPQHRRPAARAVPLLRHAPRRSQRHRPARTPPRAARPVGLRRLAESRRGAQHELARQRRGRRATGRSSATICSISARRSAAAASRRRAAAPATSSCGSRGRR